MHALYFTAGHAYNVQKVVCRWWLARGTCTIKDSPGPVSSLCPLSSFSMPNTAVQTQKGVNSTVRWSGQKDLEGGKPCPHSGDAHIKEACEEGLAWLAGVHKPTTSNDLPWLARRPSKNSTRVAEGLATMIAICFEVQWDGSIAGIAGMFAV